MQKLYVTNITLLINTWFKSWYNLCLSLQLFARTSVRMEESALPQTSVSANQGTLGSGVRSVSTEHCGTTAVLVSFSRMRDLMGLCRGCLGSL